ncbi:MAG: response regulator [Alphaproteobacteria bacterium]|nr:response regulator [Alphaproteobacteria bacterium]
MHKQKPFAGLTALVIEANRPMRVLLRGLLNGLGVSTMHEAGDAVEGFQMFQRMPVDFIITELDMMPLSGLDFVRLVRNATESPNPTIPVVMLSALAEHRLVVASRDVGVNAFMVKPLSGDSLRATLNGVLLKPRPFVRTEKYFGPDRRRKAMNRPGEAERRRAQIALLPVAAPPVSG